MESFYLLKKFISLFYILLITHLISIDYANAQEKENDVESKAKEFLAKLNVQSAEMVNKVTLAGWNYDTNLTDYNQNEMMEATMRNAKFVKDSWVEVVKFPWTTFKDPDLKRQFKFFARLGTPALPEEKLQRFTNLTSTMQSNYGKAKVCEYKNPSNCTIPLDPSLTDIFTKSRDPEELKHYWIEWRKEAGIPCRPLFQEYVGLSNEAAQLNNFTSNTEFWLEDFESDEFENDVQKLWEQTQPLYKELHAYVRFKLRQTYGDIVPENGAIPAHVLGDMWGQTWSNVFNITTPFPNKPSTDVTENMQKAGYTPLKMFKLSEEFQTSLNLTAMPQSFWEKSIIEKPADDRELVCHASAYEFQDGKDFRIKMCAQANMEDLLVIHHEMGHIQYYIQYRNLPFIYRNGANSGFHEAVGDTLALSVVTPDHLRTINLLDKNYQVDQESDLNFLYLSALTKVAFIPYSLLLDSWRWSIFRDQIKPENYNCKYWDLRWKLQGLEPPVDRSENDFDPGAKFHVAGDVPYIRYFVSFIVQFQFYKSLCIKAGQYDPHNPYTKPLHQCDFYRSTEAGNAFASMLSMGNSKPWPDAMEALTGERKMDASALLEYFAPLQKFLEEENKKNGVVVGWDNAKPQKNSNDIMYFDDGGSSETRVSDKETINAA